MRRVYPIERTVNYHEEGVISIEAALILPFVISLIFSFLGLIQVYQQHALVQIQLNKVCSKFTYDSYFLDDARLVEGLKVLYDQECVGTYTSEDFQAFRDEFTDKFIEGEFSQQDVISSEEVNNSGLSGYWDDSFLVEYIDLLSKSAKLVEVAGELTSIAGTESAYLVDTLLLRQYIKNELDNFFYEEDMEYDILNAEAFLNDDFGHVKIGWDYEIPIFFVPVTVYMTNSSGITLFNGAINQQDKYNKDLVLSSYGNSETSDSEKDQDNMYRTVYVTKMGARYHTNQTCFHIHVDAISMPYLLAKVYHPCDLCVDEQTILIDSSIVFKTTSSNIFHADPSCHAIYHDIEVMSEKEAISQGLDKCKTCESQESVEEAIQEPIVNLIWD